MPASQTSAPAFPRPPCPFSSLGFPPHSNSLCTLLPYTNTLSTLRLIPASCFSGLGFNKMVRRPDQVTCIRRVLPLLLEGVVLQLLFLTCARPSWPVSLLYGGISIALVSFVPARVAYNYCFHRPQGQLGLLTVPDAPWLTTRLLSPLVHSEICRTQEQHRQCLQSYRHLDSFCMLFSP